MGCRKYDTGRRGFTLIEMLVAIGILTVLATLSVAVIPKIQERTKAARGGDLVQGWLLIGKQRALRDRAPRGVRLIIDADLYVRTLQYIERPDNFTGGAVQFDPPGQPGSNAYKATFIGVDLTGGLDPNIPAIWPIQAGDYLQVQGGPSYLIAQVVPGTATTANYVLVTSLSTNPPGVPLWDNVNLPPAPAPTYATTAYTIIRQPRPIAGEDILQLPDDVVIDMRTVPGVGYSFPDWTAATITVSGLSYDILFTPNGTLTGRIGESNGKIVLWVRDATQDPDQPGDQPLIVVFCRTGRIGGFPYNPDPSLGNAYIYVLDPRATGL